MYLMLNWVIIPVQRLTNTVPIKHVLDLLLVVCIWQSFWPSHIYDQQKRIFIWIQPIYFFLENSDYELQQRKAINNKFIFRCSRQSRPTCCWTFFRHRGIYNVGTTDEHDGYWAVYVQIRAETRRYSLYFDVFLILFMLWNFGTVSAVMMLWSK